MKIEGKSVSYAKLHGAVFTPHGEYGPTLTETPDARNKAVKMHISDSGAFLMVDTGKLMLTVPMTNVTHFIIKPEPSHLTSVPKK